MQGQALPDTLAELVDLLADMPGVCAVVLGGSRASGVADADSDWDLGVYYRGTLNSSALASRGTVHAPGSWGRIMNGGAWLDVAGTKVDVLFRDLALVEHWCARAEAGEFEIDLLLGYLAGCPTYSLRAELHFARVLRGKLPSFSGYPSELAAAAAGRWRFNSAFSLDHAQMRAARGDAVGTLGQAAKAAIELAHARLCEQKTWVLNEKRILEQAGLGKVQAHFSSVPAPDELLSWVSDVRSALSPAGKNVG